MPTLIDFAPFLAKLSSIKITDAVSMDDQGGTTLSMEIGTRMIGTEIPEIVLNMDWSGKGFWLLYNKLSTSVFTMSWHAQVPQEIYSQLLTLAVTGLWNEDKAILRFMFGGEFNQRSDYGNAFTYLSQSRQTH